MPHHELVRGLREGLCGVLRGKPLAVDLARTPYETAKLRHNAQPARATLEGSLWMMSDNAETTIRQGAGIVTDPALNAYVGGLVEDRHDDREAHRVGYAACETREDCPR